MLPGIPRPVQSGYLDIDSFVTLRVDLPDIGAAFDAIDRGESSRRRCGSAEAPIAETRLNE
ncbi:hypothetical protein [Ruania halotolerans]|uniref:hypothetical protein n=1 Tax=Ruania halotolerans TaxID=2897773 RepID=UPI001E5FC377|nr:hypothetical protein [Ruania halotolerans]UFU05978.1 hypothetical protein LQF10_16365 [Ruania halotolerans]